MKITRILLVSLFCISIAAYAVQYQDQSQSQSTNAMVAVNGTIRTSPPTSAAPPKPYPRLLPLQLDTPPSAHVGIPLVGSVNLQNPGDPAPNAHLRLIIHDKDSRQPGSPALGPDKITVEVLESGVWKPVLLGTVEGGVMGAIGAEGVAHRERYSHDGFAIPAGLSKTWQLRVTINRPGTYSVVVSVSPDYGSTHLTQPAHSIIVVQ